MNCLVKYALAAAVPFTLASVAHAEITLCNDFRAPVYVALAAEEGPAVHAAGWWSVDPQACKTVDFPFQGTTLYYTADSGSYRAGGVTNKDHWGNRRSFFVPKRAFDLDDAQYRRHGTRLSMFSEATVAEQLRAKPVAITLRFSAGNTTVNTKSK
jgi:Protein of unknown function (DUF1036)